MGSNGKILPCLVSSVWVQSAIPTFLYFNPQNYIIDFYKSYRINLFKSNLIQIESNNKNKKID